MYHPNYEVGGTALTTHQALLNYNSADSDTTERHLVEAGGNHIFLHWATYSYIGILAWTLIYLVTLNVLALHESLW